MGVNYIKQIFQKIIALATVIIICAAMCLTVYPNPNDSCLDEESEVISQGADENGDGVCSEECDDDYKDISQ